MMTLWAWSPGNGWEVDWFASLMLVMLRGGIQRDPGLGWSPSDSSNYFPSLFAARNWRWNSSERLPVGASSMPCCQSVLSAAASAASSRSTPSWLHRLHAKGGLSFPSHLHIDDLLYGQPPPLPLPPPPSSSSNRLHAVAQQPPPKPKHSKPKPRSSNSSRPNPSSLQRPLSAVISDLFAIPSDLPPPSLLKAFRKQSRPRPRPDNSPSPHRGNKDKKAKAKAKKRRRAERAADADVERSTKTEVTIIDTSTDGWKADKVLVRKGAVWKVRDKKASGVSEHEDLNKGKRRAGLVSKMQRDKAKEKEKGREATFQGNIDASSGDVMKESDDLIQTLKRPRCSEPVPEGQSAGILHSQTTNRGKKNGLASPKGDLKGK